MWWGYEYVCHNDKPPPLVLYRDDHFIMTVPYLTGLEIREAIRTRLKEAYQRRDVDGIVRALLPRKPATL